MKLFLKAVASFPVIFLSTAALTLFLFETLDILVAGKRRDSRFLRLLLSSANGAMACGYLFLIGSANPNTPTLTLVLLMVLIGTLGHTLLGKDNKSSYTLMGGCCLLNSVALYLIVYSIYRLLPFDFQELGGMLCQRFVFAATNISLCGMVSLFRARWFPGRELSIAIHEKQYSALQYVWFPAVNFITLFCGACILPLAQIEMMNRRMELYFYAMLLAWNMSSLISCYIILFVQGRQIRSNEAQEKRLDEEQCRADALQELADQHPLTGLLNHRAWSFRARRALEHSQGGAVVMLDLDHFKDVNDTYGHQAGDCVLMDVAQLLRRSFRATDPAGHIVGHVGGDEFCVFIAGQISKEIICRRMDELLTRSRAEHQTRDGGGCRISFSSGVAVAPEHGSTLEELVHHADNALYRVKALGGDSWAMYQEDA